MSFKIVILNQGHIKDCKMSFGKWWATKEEEKVDGKTKIKRGEK